jgi:hypothetical protein
MEGSINEKIWAGFCWENSGRLSRLGRGKRTFANGMLVAHASQRSATGNPEQKTQLY